jgi:hypothetical protein
MRLAGYVARMGRGEACTGFVVGKPEETQAWMGG